MLRRWIAMGGVLLGTLLLVAVWLLMPCGTNLVIQNPQTPASRLELMPESSPEFSENHILGIDGKDLEVDIAYRDDGTGQRSYREAQPRTIAEEVKISAADEVLLQAKLDLSGTVVQSGFEFVPEGGVLWRAFTDAGGVSHKLLYWPDGKTLYAEEKQRTGEQWKDVTFYYKATGKPWLHYVGEVDVDKWRYLPLMRGRLKSAQLFQESGSLVFDLQSMPDHSRIYTLYRPDGTRWHTQRWVEHRSCDSHGYCGDTISVAGVTFYSDDGASVKRIVEVSPGADYHRYPKYTDFETDGRWKVVTLDEKEVPSRVDFYAADGSRIDGINVSGGTDEFDLDYKFQVPPDFPDTIGDWLKNKPKWASQYAGL